MFCICYCVVVEGNDKNAVFQLSESRESTLVQAGQSSYKELTAGISSFSSCWGRILTTLTGPKGCSSLNEETRQRFAFQLTNCHLERSGYSKDQLYSCGDFYPIADCVQPMTKNPIAFNAYTEFLLHADNICFYLEREKWEKRAENNINDLLSLSEFTADGMQVLRSSTKEIEAGINKVKTQQQELESLQNQMKDQMNDISLSQKQNFLEISQGVSQTLQDTLSLKHQQEQFKTSQLQISENFNQFSILQSRYFDQIKQNLENISTLSLRIHDSSSFLSFFSFPFYYLNQQVFYLTCIIFILFMTCFSYFRSSRMHCLFIVFGSWIYEHWFSQMIMKFDEGNFKFWICISVMVVLAIGFVRHDRKKYKDRELLIEMRKANQEVIDILNNIQKHKRTKQATRNITS